jgi:hypothetical protein
MTLTRGFYWARHKHYEPRWEVVEVVVDEPPDLGVLVYRLGDDGFMHGQTFLCDFEVGPKLEPPAD